MEVCLMPQQKVLDETKKRQVKETPEELYSRVYQDILSRPSKYFLGYTKEKRKYGKKFFRQEFPIDTIVEQYKQVVLEIMSCRYTGNFYKNWKVCNNVYPGIQCDYQTICRNGNISEEMYKVRDK
jgi:hypothetical protein